MARELVLASRSPRRRQLLDLLGLPVRVEPADIPEAIEPGEDPAAYVTRLAVSKAQAVPGDFVLGADTIVVLDDAILEKPTDTDDALSMLMRLQGRTHLVFTACALASSAGVASAIDTTRVTIRPLAEPFLRDYVATGEPMDKAGAYGIQGYGAALVERVEGDFFSVMGLPLRLVLDLLDGAGWNYTFTR